MRVNTSAGKYLKFYRNVVFLSLALIVAGGTGSAKAAMLDAVDMIGQVDGSGNPVWNGNVLNNGKILDSLKGIAIDEVRHRMFLVKDWSQIAVYNLDSSNEPLDDEPDFVLASGNFHLSAQEGTAQNKFKGPAGVVYDAVRDRLFVADTVNNRVLIYDTSTLSNNMSAQYVLGQTDFDSNSPSSARGGMYQPQDVALDTLNNRLYVSDGSNYRVLMFDLSAGISNGMEATNVIGYGQIVYSFGIAVDSSSQLLFVTDYSGAGVHVYDLSAISDDMVHINWLGLSGGCSATSLPSPIGVVADSAAKRLFVADNGNNRTLVFDYSQGITDNMVAINVIGQSGFDTCDENVVSLEAIRPANMAYSDISQKLYVVNANNNGYYSVKIFSTSQLVNGLTPAYLLSGVDAYGFQQDTSYQGNSTYLDADGHRLFVADVYNNRVLIFELNEDNTFRHRYADHVLGQPNFNDNNSRTSRNGMSRPSGIAYDSTRELLFVSENNNSRVLVFDIADGITDGMDADFVLGQADFVSNEYSTTRNRFSRIDGAIFYDNESQQLFVGDYNGRRVLVFGLAGGISNNMDADFVIGQVDFESVDTTPSQTVLGRDITSLSYDPERKLLFVSDRVNRVIVFDILDGITNGMAASFVLGQNDFDSSSSGLGQNTMDAPNSTAYNPITKQLFVGDRNNNRVLVFDLVEITNGENAMAVLGQNDFNSKIAQTAQNTLRAPSAMALDIENNRLLVNDRDSARITLTQLPVMSELPDPELNQAYSEIIPTTGGVGPYAYTLQSGALPDGLALDGETGTISGTPSQTGTFDFTLKVQDSAATEPETIGLIGVKQYILMVGAGSGGVQVTQRAVSVLNVPAMEAELAGGYMAIAGTDPTQTSAATFTVNYLFGAGKSGVFIPAGTIMTAQDGSLLDLTRLAEKINGRTSALKTLGSLRFGVFGSNLVFSKPVTVNIAVASGYDGKNFPVYYQKEGDMDWNRETSCKIKNSVCSFQTSHATSFVVIKSKLIDKNSDRYKDYLEKRRKYSNDLNQKRFFSVRELRKTAKEEYFKLKHTYEQFIKNKQKLKNLDVKTQEQIRVFNGYLNYKGYTDDREWAEGR